MPLSLFSANSPANRIFRIALGPILAAVVYGYLAVAVPELAYEARATAAVATLMALWWMTEAIPLPATALLPLVLLPLAGVFPGESKPIEVAAAPYAHRLVFLFMGGFLIALSIEKWNLHRRIALTTLLAVGTGPYRLIAGFMIATAALSMWISNTATTLMMLPIAMSIVRLMYEQNQQPLDLSLETTPPQLPEQRQRRDIERFATCMMLCVAYAASIGGLSTFIGTPPNGRIKAYLDDIDRPISFMSWMGFALPLTIVLLLLTWLLLTRVVFRFKLPKLPGGRVMIQSELREMGRVSRGERTVLIVFLMTAFLWFFRQPLANWEWLAKTFPPVTRLDDSVIGMMGGLILFVIPVDLSKREFALDWKTAEKLPWGILLLFGGGLSLAVAFEKSGLGAAIGQWVSSQGNLSLMALVVLVTILVVFLTELTSNLATANLLIPILDQVARGIQTEQGTGVDPLILIVPAALAASCAFMFPVATPPNAIVFASGHLRIGQMIRAGFVLNILAIILIPFLVFLLGPPLLGIKL